MVYVPLPARAWRAHVQSWIDRAHGELHAAGTEAAHADPNPTPHPHPSPTPTPTPNPDPNPNPNPNSNEAALFELLVPLSHHLPAALDALAAAQAAPTPEP